MHYSSLALLRARARPRLASASICPFRARQPVNLVHANRLRGSSTSMCLYNCVFAPLLRLASQLAQRCFASASSHPKRFLDT
jgi:hypothetical protein